MIATRADLRQLLEPLRLPLYDALEVGLSKRDAHRRREKIVDPWYDAHTVRLHAKHRLTQLDTSAFAIDPAVANSGIHLVLGDRSDIGKIRVIKGRLARVPGPGRSQRQRDFWEAGGQGVLDLGLRDQFTVTNVLALWDIDTNGEIILAAAVPEGSWDFIGEPILGPSTLLAPRAVEDGEFDPGAEDEGHDLVKFDKVDRQVEVEGGSSA